MPRKGASAGGNGEVAQPKGRMTPYAFFVQICREEHRRKFPDEQVAFQEFTKKCAERWKTMTDKEKLKFRQLSEEDKKRYDVEMAAFNPTPAQANNPTKPQKNKKRKKDPNAPKRSMSAFFWFSQDERKKVRAANPNFGVGEVAKELGRRWSDAEAALKSKYEALAEKDRVRYGKEKKAYQQQINEEKRLAKGGNKKPKLDVAEPQNEGSTNGDNDDGDEGEDSE